MNVTVRKIKSFVSAIREGKLNDIILNLPRRLRIKNTGRRYAKIVEGLDVKQFFIINRNRSVVETRFFQTDKEAFEKILNGNRKILFYNTDEASLDIKYKWEQDRLQHLLVLGGFNDSEFYKHVAEAIGSIDDEQDKRVSMEYAISAINVIEAVKVNDNHSRDEDRADNIGEYLKRCLIYILNNLEDGKILSANHYFFDLIGALWIVNHTKISELKGLAEFLNDELEQLLGEIISEDGSLYEGSTFYHRFVCESLLEYIYLNNEEHRSYLKSKVEKMVRFAIAISEEDEIFGFGDNDSGRILALPAYFDYSSRNIALIKWLFKSLYSGMEKSGCDVSATLNDRQKETSAYIQTEEDIKYLKNFGLVIIRKKCYSVAFRCDEGFDKKANKYIGGHRHNDLLSVEIRFCGKPLIVSRGTYLYIPNYKHRYENLRTSSHSVLCIDGIEQNKIYNDWRYSERKYLCKNVRVAPNYASAEFVYAMGIKHKREVCLKESGFVIFDYVSQMGNNSPDICVQFYLDDKVNRYELKENRLTIFRDNYVIVISSNGLIAMRSYDIYPEYGMKIKSHIILIKPIENCTKTEFKCIRQEVIR